MLNRGWPEDRAVLMLALFTITVGMAQIPMPTRSDGNRRFPVEVTARDLYRLQVARTDLPADAPVALQFGLWGITPTRPGMLALTVENLLPEAYVFLDLKAAYGMPQDQYLEVARTVMDDVHAGERRLLHQKGELYLVSPKVSGTPD
ncbi:MAG: hypothetical protein H0U67_10680 [Gemmatimonadetes bacterium]|nr:hypothetical protein [Gemmatimonadota bacterium]